MIDIYLNTAENLFFDAAGNEWRDGTPRFTIRGQEICCFYLVADSPDFGTEAARPDTWTPDDSWAEIPGISAMLTVDSDFKHRIKAKNTAEAEAGSTEIILQFSGISNYDEIPTIGIVTLYTASGESENIGYSSRSIVGNTVFFVLNSPLVNGYPAGSTVDVRQSPLCIAYLDSAASDWESGKLVFELSVDSVRLRSITEYSDAATISIEGVELMIYSTDPEESTIHILRSFLWDTPVLVNTLGDPGYSAPVPDQTRDYISSEISRQIEERILNGSW